MERCYKQWNKRNKEKWLIRTQIPSKRKKKINWSKMGIQDKEECKKRSRN